jgi:hypothetical protein
MLIVGNHGDETGCGLWLYNSLIQEVKNLWNLTNEVWEL